MDYINSTEMFQANKHKKSENLSLHLIFPTEQNIAVVYPGILGSILNLHKIYKVTNLHLTRKKLPNLGSNSWSSLPGSYPLTIRLLGTHPYGRITDAE